MENKKCSKPPTRSCAWEFQLIAADLPPHPKPIPRSRFQLISSPNVLTLKLLRHSTISREPTSSAKSYFSAVKFSKKTRMCFKTSSVMINEKIGMEERPCPSGRKCAWNHKLLTWAKWCGRGMRTWHFRGAWGKNKSGDSWKLFGFDQANTKDYIRTSFLSQHMAFIHIIDVPWVPYIYMIFQTNIMYLNKMYQGILFHRASWFYWFSVWHPFRWFAYSFIPLPCMLPLRKHSRLADIHSEFKQFELWQECLNLSLWHYTIYYIFRPNLNTLQKIRKKVSLSRLWNIPPIARNYDIIQYHTKIYSYHSETYRPNAIFHTSSGETWRQNIGNLMVDSHPIGNDHPLRIVRHILLRCQWTYG